MVGLDPDWLCFSSSLNTACIICTNNAMTPVISLVTDNSIFLTLTLANGSIVIGSVYAAPSGNLDSDLACWIHHFTDCSNLLVGGDFNVPLRSLGYTREDVRTETFLEYLMLSDLRLINDPGAPHSFVQDDRTGRPDLTLVGKNLLPYIQNWSVDDSFFSFSDHRYITYKLDMDIIFKSLMRFKTKNKTMKKFNRIFGLRHDQIMDSLERVTNTDGLEDWMENFYDYLQYTMNRSFKFGPLTNKPSTRWYTDELRVERNKVNAHYKRYRKNLQNLNYRDSYITARRAYKQNIRKTKRASWIRFCSRIEDAYGNLYKFISGKKTSHSDMAFSTLESSEVFDSYDVVAESLMQEHFKINAVPQVRHEFVSASDFKDSQDYHPFTKRELKAVLGQQNNNKAPGHDNIDALVVKNLCKTFTPLMLLLFNTCLRLAHFPRVWKKAVIIFFRKRNRPLNSPRSYRPISLLPIMGKVYERLLKIRIMTMLESNAFFDDNQHGFREGKSTKTALHTLKMIVKEKLSIFKYCAAISFDISGAFDVLNWMIASEIMKDLPLYNYLIYILRNFISHRQIGFKFLRGIRWFRIYFGCPQGSCLGPLVWLLVADVILKRSKALSIDTISYADDSIVLDGANTRSALEHKINDHVANFVVICNSLDLTINVGKTVAILFGTKTMKKRRPVFKLNGRSIPVKDSILYLGFQLDSTFNWLEHLQMVRAKVTFFTCNARRTRIRDQGVPLSFLKIWYLTVLKKQISYGHEIWFGDLNYHGLQRLSSCQRVCLLSIVRSYRSVSTNALCVLAGIPPIHLELASSALYYQIIHGNSSIEIEGLRIDSGNIMKKLPSYTYPQYYLNHRINFVNPLVKEAPLMNHPIIYTDGSRMTTGVSAAFTVSLKNNTIFEQRIKLNNFNTIYQAELVAIQEAVDWCRSAPYVSFHLYTDSLSSYSSLQRLFPTDDILYNIFTNLRLLQNKIIHVGWVKAHVGIAGNERADELAKSVILENKYDKEIDLPVPLSLVKKFLKDKLKQDWQTHWDQSTKGRDTYRIIRKVDQDFLCISQVSLYFLTAHGSFPVFLYKIGKRDNDRCTCGRQGDVKHYLFDSCGLVPERFDFIRNRTLEWNIQTVLLSSSNQVKLRAIYNILNKHYSFIRYVF